MYHNNIVSMLFLALYMLSVMACMVVPMGSSHMSYALYVISDGF